jgi:hypothetical protein
MSDNSCRPFAQGAFTAALAAIVLSAPPAVALDPVLDPLETPSGPTAGKPSESARNILREAERGPTLSERFGLPRISGPIPPILPPLRQQPIFDTPDSAPPPNRARRPSPDG